MTEKSNAKEYPKFYYARHMKEGVCGYGNETVLLRDDVVKSMTRSFDGKPVYVLHDDRTESERIETIKETSCGYVTESFYNEQDGWFWVKMMIVDDEGHEKIANGWSVSNAYIPTEDAKGGTKHNVPYNREITNAYYTHLAIVPNPRYEEAKIFTPDEFKTYQDEKRQQLNELKNSTEEQKGIIMKFFKFAKEEVSEVDKDTFVEITNDDGSVSEIKVSDMMDTVSAEKQNEKDEPNMEAVVTLDDGETTTLGELINSYQESMKPKAEVENKCDEDEDDEDEKENEADDAEKEDESDDEKMNHIDELKNAHKVPAAPAALPYLKIDGLALGKSKY